MCYNIFMAIRTEIFSEGEFYHIYNRGNSKQVIFKNANDYNRFVQLLYISNSSKNFNLSDLKDNRRKDFDIFSFDRGGSLVAIGAYCLMPLASHSSCREWLEQIHAKIIYRIFNVL